MTTLYDGNGNVIEISGGNSGTSSCDFNVTGYSTFEDNEGNARQATLTYQGKRLYPTVTPNQVTDKIKNYGGGVMLTLGDSYTAYMNSHFSAIHCNRRKEDIQAAKVLLLVLHQENHFQKALEYHHA